MKNNPTAQNKSLIQISLNLNQPADRFLYDALTTTPLGAISASKMARHILTEWAQRHCDHLDIASYRDCSAERKTRQPQKAAQATPVSAPTPEPVLAAVPVPASTPVSIPRPAPISTPALEPDQAPPAAQIPGAPGAQIERASPPVSPPVSPPKPASVLEPEKESILTQKPAAETQVQNDVSNIVFESQPVIKVSHNFN